MHFQTPDEQSHDDAPAQPDGNELPVSAHAAPVNVPVFSCIVLVASASDGGVRARVANLAGLECTAATEREALAKLVAAFKQKVAQLLRGATPIPWIEPPISAEDDEQQRFIPVHL